MEKKSSQFGVWALFVLTGAAAVCFAVLRLPLDGRVKIVLVEVIVVSFLLWAARGRAPLDPRLKPMMAIALSAPLIGYSTWSYFRMRTHPLFVFDCIIGALLLVFLVASIYYAIGAVRYVVEARKLP